MAPTSKQKLVKAAEELCRTYMMNWNSDNRFIAMIGSNDELCKKWDRLLKAVVKTEAEDIPF